MSQINLSPATLRAAFVAARAAHNAGPADAQHRSPIAPPATRPLAGSVNGATTVQGAIANAADQTGVDFDFLIAQAQVESAMNPSAEARTSSASGLYQFIDSTWLSTMQRHGERFGMGDIAAQIGTNRAGAPFVADPAARADILALRHNPQVASLMAAGLAQDNRAHLTPILGREPDHSELYLAHFLGAGGAGRFLSEMHDDPSQSAADLFRRPAAANRPVFYDRSGAARSLAGVMDYLTSKLDRARDVAGGDTSSTPPVPPELHPHIIVEDDALAPRNPPVLTPVSRPALARATSPAAPITPPPIQARTRMSDLLQSAFAETGRAGSSHHNGGVARAYQQLKAMGL